MDSSSFLTNLHDQLRKYHPGYDLDEELFLNVLLRRTFKDHQRLRLHSYLWIAFLATPITFISAIIMSHSLDLLNVIRIIILLVLPIVMILSPEVNFANRLENKYRSEKIIERERNISYEKSVYNKFLLAGSMIVVLIACSYIIY